VFDVNCGLLLSVGVVKHSPLDTEVCKLAEGAKAEVYTVVIIIAIVLQVG
jgi:hypothetical protein